MPIFLGFFAQLHIAYTYRVVLFSDGTGTRNPIFAYPQSLRKIMGEGKLNKAFLHFFAIFDDFPKFLSNFSTLIFEKSSNMAKLLQNMEDSPVQLA